MDKAGVEERWQDAITQERRSGKGMDGIKTLRPKGLLMNLDVLVGRLSLSPLQAGFLMPGILSVNTGNRRIPPSRLNV